MSTRPLPHPDEFLDVRVHRLDLQPGLTAVCAGYELGQWRAEQLGKHLLEWLPEFVLRHGELDAFGHQNAVKLIGRAAQTIYTSNSYEKRGEIGEILLHIVCRQVFNTIPAINKLYYKDSANDTVKGFDAVHVVVADQSLELWLGEAKFYSDISAAIRDVVEELSLHCRSQRVLDFMRLWAGFHFPRLLLVLDRIQKSVFRRRGMRTGDYEFFASRVENLFLDPTILALDEYGIPVEVALKLSGVLQAEGNLDQVLERLRRLDVDRTALTAFEKSIIRDTQSFL